MGGTDDLVAALEALAVKENAAPSQVFKAFNDFARANSQEISQNCSAVLEKFRPTTRIGRILRIRLADRFHVHAEILKLLQSGDSLDTNQALKCRWFFAELTDPENFVDQVLPTLSFTVRLKVVNKYSSCLKNTASAESLYSRLKSRYGLRDAVPVLPVCSESFIRDELPNLNGVALRPKLTLALLEKYPSLGTEYLTYIVDENSQLNESERSYSLYSEYGSSFHKLSQVDLGSFINMYVKHHSHTPHMSVGRRVTKRCIKHHFDQVLTDYDNCGRFLDRPKFYKRLSYEQMKALICRQLPETLTEFFGLNEWEDVVYLVKEYAAPNARCALLKESFVSKYGKEPFPKFLPKFGDYWIDVIPMDSRADKVEMKLKEEDGPRVQAKFLAYLPIDESIPRLKKLIEAQSEPDVRRAIAGHMVSSFLHNKHFRGVGDLFAYFNKRFRNEIKDFRHTILMEFDRWDVKVLYQLREDDWASMDELMEIIKLNKEVSYMSWTILSVLKKQIHCFFMHAINVEPLLQKYLDLVCSVDDFNEGTWAVAKNTVHERECVEWFLNKIPTLEWESNSSKAGAYWGIVQQVVEVNQKLPVDNLVVLPEEIIVGIEGLMTDSESHDSYYFRMLVHQARSIPTLWDRLLRSAFPKYIPEGVLNRFLRLDPALVLKELDAVLEVTFGKNFRKYRSFYAKCRLYESYGIPQELARVCRVNLKLEKDTKDSSLVLESSAHPLAVQVLSMVSEPLEYAKLVSKYAPEKGTIEDYSDEVTEMFALQKAVCRSFAGFSNPAAVLPLLRKFTVGDYLKIAVGALTAVFSRLPEKDVLPLLEKWTDCPVSLRKHVLRLMYRLAPAQSRAIFLEFLNNEKNTSLRRVIFLEIHKTFVVDPSDRTFAALSSAINLLTDEDEALKDLFSVDSMNSTYVSKYLELVWNKIHEWESLQNGNTKLIECINERIVKNLDDKFCGVLLHHVLEKLPDPLPDFVCLSIFHGQSLEGQLDRLRTVIDALAPFVRDKWNDRSSEPGQVFKVRRTVSDFVDELCEAARSSKEKAGTSRVLTEAKTALAAMNPLRDSVQTLYRLDAHVLFLNQKDSFESSLAELMKSYVVKYETTAPHSLLAALSDPLPMLSSPTKLAHELVQTELPLCQILAAKFAQTRISSEEELPLFDKILEILSSSDNLDVQNASALFFKKLESQLIN